MFGLSITKLLLLVLVVLAVLFGARLFRQFTGSGNERQDRRRVDDDKGRGGEARHDVEDTVECRRCGVFVTRNSGDCGKPGCPFAR